MKRFLIQLPSTACASSSSSAGPIDPAPAPSGSSGSSGGPAQAPSGASSVASSRKRRIEVALPAEVLPAEETTAAPEPEHVGAAPQPAEPAEPAEPGQEETLRQATSRFGMHLAPHNASAPIGCDLLDLTRPGEARWCRIQWEEPGDIPTYLPDTSDFDTFYHRHIHVDIGLGLMDSGPSRVKSIFVPSEESIEAYLSALLNQGYVTEKLCADTLEQLKDFESWRIDAPKPGDLVRVSSSATYALTSDGCQRSISHLRGLLAGVLEEAPCLPGKTFIKPRGHHPEMISTSDLEMVQRSPRAWKAGLLITLAQARVIWPAEESGRVLRWPLSLRLGCTYEGGPRHLPWHTGKKAFLFCKHERRVISYRPSELFSTEFRGIPYAPRVHVAPLYEFTGGEPLGSFSICVRLRAPTLVSELAEKLSRTFGLCSMTPLGDHNKPIIVPRDAPSWDEPNPLLAAEHQQLKGLVDWAALDEPSSKAAQALLDLLGSPQRYATTLTPMPPTDADQEAEGAEAPSVWLRALVSVSLRPLAFVPLDERSAGPSASATASAASEALFGGLLVRKKARTAARTPTEQIENLFELLGFKVPPLVHECRKPKLPIAPARGGCDADKETEKRGSELVNRLMNAVQQHTAARTDVAATPAGLKCELRPVQQRALAFMLSRERDVDGAPKDFARLPTPGGHSVYYGRTAFCLRRPASGGFLMQEMGIGKTVEALALVLANPRPLDDPDAPLGTLVVCPTTLLANWKSEIEKLMPRRTRWLVLNSAAKKAHDTPSKLSRYHVVVTSYTLLSGSPALKAKWRRVIFDESQTVKEVYTVQARAAEQIIAPFRWALSGTPMPKDVGDLKGQLNVLQTFPFYGSALGDSSNRFEARLLPGPGNKAWAESRWGGESEGKLSEGKASGKADKIKGTAGAQEQPVLRFLCDFAFRSTIEGESLGLPPLTIANELLEPSEADAEQLAAVRASVAEQVARLERAQALEYRMPLLHSLLMRLRLACDHPSLAIDALQRMRELSEQARAEGEKLSVPEVRLDVVLKEAKPKPILHKWLNELLAPLTPTPGDDGDGSGNDGGGSDGGGFAECVIW